MALLVLVAVVVALLFGLGLAIDFLIWVALFAAVLWAVGFLVRGAENTWYRW